MSYRNRKPTFLTKSEIFKAAHALAKAVRKPGDAYRGVFGKCLQYIATINNTAKAHVAVESANLWRGGRNVRLYLNFAVGVQYGGQWFLDINTGRITDTAYGTNRKNRDAIEAFTDKLETKLEEVGI